MKDYSYPAMRIMVAGGAGFLGSHLCRALLGAGHEVVCVDNFATGRRENIADMAAHAGFSVLRHDIADPLVAQIDRIYNLACPASPRHYQADPVGTVRTCVQGTHRLLELAEHCGARLLQASTSEVYGDAREHPQRESYWGHVNPVGPRACYDEGKRCAETLCAEYGRRHPGSVRVARIFNTYGPMMAPGDGRVVCNFIVQALAGQPLTVYGRGEQTRSFCYVSDLIAGLNCLMESDADPGPVNLGNPEERTVLQVAEAVRALTGSRSAVQFGPLPVDDPVRRCPDISLARAQLGWQPRTPFEEGLARTIAFFQGRAAARPLSRADAVH